MIMWYDWCGYVGVLLVLLAFLLLQAHKLHPNRWIYQWMNLLGAIGILLSLTFGPHNWPAFVMEVLWGLIAIYGITASRRKRLSRRDGSSQL